ncbi:Uncharacterised protein [Salmonella enterica subsp. enterica serovar Bovismorbificans]|nr:Uncharacterised protein [Salmonella enterica subsp. enterica serovar Bovismorbificans]
MQHAFRLAGGAGGIKDKQRIFGIHRFRLVLRAGFFNQIAPPQVAAFLPVNVVAGALQDDHMLNASDIRVFQRVIDILFQRDTASGTYTFVSGDHQPRAGVDNASGDGFRREAPEDHRMHRADAGAGQHCHRRFRHHRHINRYHIAFFNAQIQQCIRETADIAMQFAIRDMFTLRRVIAFPDNGGAIAIFLQMAVKTVRRQIQRAVLVPFNRHIAWRKGGVFHFLVRRDPIENFSLFAPKRIGVVNRLFIFSLILLWIYQATIRNVGGNGVFMCLAHAVVLLVEC